MAKRHFLRSFSSSLSLLSLLSFILFPAGMSIHVPQAYAASYTVTSTSDAGPGTLRKAIEDANANAGADVITCDAALSGTITLASNLPDLTEGVSIDCSGAAGAVTITGGYESFVFASGSAYVLKGFTIGNSSISVQSGVSDVTLGGANSGEGLVLSNGGITIQGSNINVINVSTAPGFNAGTAIDVLSAANNVTLGSAVSNGGLILTNSGGSPIVIDGDNVTVVNSDLTYNGDSIYSAIDINSSASGITIGGSSSSERNILGGTYMAAAIVSDGSDVTISGNYIGTNAGGTAADANYTGIRINSGTNITIGGASSAEGNLISGNTADGIDVVSGVTDVSIQNNIIGLNAAGNAPIPNGIDAINAQTSIVISDNIISGNTGQAVNILDQSASIDGVIISRNYIGTNVAGTSAIGNGSHGLSLGSVSGDYTLTNVTIQNNLISGNEGKAIVLYDNHPSETAGFNIWGNKIGTDVTGLVELTNAGGVDLGVSDVDMDASLDSNKRNIIAGSDAETCIQLTGAAYSVIKGNYCGIGADGATEMPTSIGIQITGAGHDNIVGGITSAEKNLICASDSFNINFGLGMSGNGNSFRGNDVLCNIEVPIVSFGGLVPALFTRYPGATGNSNYSAPSVDSATGTTVMGSDACATCAVDLYAKSASHGAIYITSVAADGDGNFAFTGLNLSGYTHVVAAYTDADGSTSPSSLSLALSANSAPSLGTVSATAATDGSQTVAVTVTDLDDPEEDPLNLQFEYSLDGGETWHDATLSSPSSGTLDNEDTYQISGLDTSSGPISSFSAVWNAGTNSSGVELSTARLRVTPNDGLVDGSSASSSDFSIDTATPENPSLDYSTTLTSSSLAVTGTGTEANSSIYLDGVDTGSDTDGSGNFSISISILGNGSFTKTLTVVDSFGNVSSGASISGTRSVPVPPAAPSGGNSSSSNSSSSESISSPESTAPSESMAGEPQNVVDTPTETTTPVEEAVVEVVETPVEVVTPEVIAPVETAIETPVVEESPREAFVDAEPAAPASVVSSSAMNSATFGKLTDYGVPEILVELATGGSRKDMDNFDPKGDEDGDGVYNYEELIYFCNIGRSDTDGDGLSDVQEIFGGTTCNSYDSDGDGLSDSQDAEPLAYQAPEVDSKTLTSYTQEYLASVDNPETAPSIQVADSDGDGLSDWLELSLKTNPTDADSDKDGLADGLERSLYGTDPTQSTAKEELDQLRFSNLNSCSAVEQGGVRFVGHGLPNSSVFLYRLAEDGEQILVGEATTDEQGVFQTLAYGFEPGDNNVFATSGKNRRNIAQITPVATIHVLEDGGIAAPSLKENGLTGDKGTAQLELSAEPGKELFITWQSTVFSNVLIADASQVSLNKALPKGDHTVTWQARDLESGICSSPEQSIFNVTHAGFVNLGSAEKAPFRSLLGATLMLASLAGLGYVFQKKRS